MKRQFLLTVILGLIVSVAHARGGIEHVVGTTTSITKTFMTIKTPDGKSQTITLVPSTKYMRINTPILQKGMKVGDYAIILARRRDNRLVAVAVVVGVDRDGKKMNSNTGDTTPE